MQRQTDVREVPTWQGGRGHCANHRDNRTPPPPRSRPCVCMCCVVLCVVRVRLTEQNQYYDRVENVC